MEKKNIYTLKLSELQENKLFDAWQDTASPAPAYARWQLRPENCVITCYTSGKTVFQGKEAYVYASPFLASQMPSTASADDTPAAAESLFSASEILPQAGSDEVGTGDYFGPVCVCAAYVTQETARRIHELGVRDSKQLKDEDIRKIGAELMELVPHSLLIVTDSKYNEVHASSNMNKIKAMLHNQAYVNLSRKIALPDFRIVDQFTPEAQYYRYLKDVPLVIRGIHFETKAEDKYTSVGTASVIARYAFLKCMDQLEERYNMKFHKGAGADVDRCAGMFVEKYGFDRLREVAKLHFKNTEKLK